MVTFDFHASHEQFPRRRRFACVRMAERAGFRAAMCSDHFHPRSERQGQSGFAWSCLGAALQATSLPLGVVCAPGQRYHPAVAVIAQAAATLAEMFPGRFRLALGSDEAPNEHVTGGLWPEPHVAWLRHDVELGFSGIYLNNVGGNLPYFIETFGERVLPAVARS